MPNRDRLVVVEVREANTAESTLVRYGVSPELSLGAGETRVVEVEAALWPPPSVSLSVPGTSSAGPELL